MPFSHIVVSLSILLWWEDFGTHAGSRPATINRSANRELNCPHHHADTMQQMDAVGSYFGTLTRAGRKRVDQRLRLGQIGSSCQEDQGLPSGAETPLPGARAIKPRPHAKEDPSPAPFQTARTLVGESMEIRLEEADRIERPSGKFRVVENELLRAGESVQRAT